VTPAFDVVGVGLNATDTMILIPHFPAYGGKVQIAEELISPGGQVASAMVCCAQLGLRTKYAGAVGDDERGRILLEGLRRAGVDTADVLVRPGCSNQTAYILIDQSTGERTVFWSRPDGLKVHADEIRPEMITSARLLHIDGCDAPAAERAARLAREAGIPVTMDVDTIYPGLDQVLPHVDYLIASSEFPERWTGERDPLQALERIQTRFGMRVAAMTLGAYGALARFEGRYAYSPAFVVSCVDTTGAGDVFHGAFCYAILKGQDVARSLDFSNALAAINCTALGAWGASKSVAEAAALMERGERRAAKEFEKYRV